MILNDKEHKCSMESVFPENSETQMEINQVSSISSLNQRRKLSAYDVVSLGQDAVITLAVELLSTPWKYEKCWTSSTPHIVIYRSRLLWWFLNVLT